MPNVARVASRRVFPAALSGISVMALVNLLLAYQNAHLKPFSFDAEAARATRVVHWIEPAFTPVQFKAYRRFKMMTIRMPRAGFRRSQGRVRVVEWTSSHRRLEMSSEQGGTVVIRSFWFPGWVGTIDGRSLDLAPLPDIGVVSFDVPSGDHTITLDFARSPVRTASLWVGLTMLLVTPLLGIWSDRRRAGRD